MSKLQALFSGLLLLVLGLSAGCGGGGGSSSASEQARLSSSTISGSVVKSPIEGAEVRLYRFDEGGALVEIAASNAPVMTSASGGFSFSVKSSDVSASAGPLLLMTHGGSMNLEDAPQLSGVVADPSILSTAGNSLRRHLTVASSVAAGILKFNAESSGTAPSKDDANEVIGRVENEMHVSLADDPSMSGTPIAYLNMSIDANLNLIAMPQNNPAVDDLIDYLVMNFSCASKHLDKTMSSPSDPTNRSYPATFKGVGSGALDNLLPGGPESFMMFTAPSIDKDRIENDGFDTATVTASFMNGVGEPAGDGIRATVETVAGRLVISKNNPLITDGAIVVYVSSVWEGDAQIMVGITMPTGETAAETFDIKVVNEVVDVEDTDHPRLISAGSTDNTEVLVSFSEAMLGGIESAENPSHYRITATEPLAAVAKTGGGSDVEKPEVVVMDAQLILPDRRTVRLTTYSQSDLEYELSVINMTDLAGNTMAPPDGSINPSVTTFQGTPPSGTEVRDTDGDGLSDADEQRGWIVTTVTANGVELTFEVTSDPNNADTDGDGIPDGDEFQGGMNPRTADSDGDTLTDYEEWHIIHSNALNQDTDGDGLEDGFEYKVLRTSPILADTDGDQLADPDEVAAGNRNPLIADLPSPRINIGNVNLQLDTRFSFTSETGESVSENKTFESTITRGEDETFSTSNQNSTKSTLEFSEELQASFNAGPGIFAGVDIQTTIGSKQGSERGNTFTVGEESSRSSEETYHDSLSTTATRDIREAVTREIVDAAMKVDVSIDNVGDIPFTISNLELSAQVQDPLDRRRMIPVAALVPELGSVNIGALGDPSRGPFVFNTVSVFPQQVQELMKNPRGLVVQLANFDITDNEGHNFAFTSQEVLDRTAGITFDLGDGRVESYRVATASTHDLATGRPVGIEMEYLLEIIGLQRYPTIRDGGNGIAETTASGDDEAVSSIGASIEPGQVIIEAGDDGFLNTTPLGDDVWVEPDYETALQRDFDTIRDGGNGIAETTAEGDDVQQTAVGSTVNPGQVLITVGADEVLNTTAIGGDDVIVPARTPDHQVLTRFRDVEVDTSSKRFWALFQSKARSGVDLDKFMVRAGEQFDFTYVQDKDDDGVWAREEFIHGSSDLLPNTDGCDRAPPPEPCDTLTDKEEIQEGWRVQLRSSPQAIRVYPNPNQGDSDRDSLTDHEEKACLLDPRQRDTDLDGLTDWEELNGKRIVDGVITQMTSRDYDSNAIAYVITPYAGETDPSGTGVFPHDVIEGCSESGFATDPLDADTDGDLVNDALELLLGLNPNDSTDGPTFLDDDGDGVPNSKENIGWKRFVNGKEVTFTSNPNVPDSDHDLLPDLLEFYIGSNPGVIDTDGDKITDTNEYKAGGDACVTETVGEICVPWADRLSFTYLEYLAKCASAPVCNIASIDQSLSDASARGYGTNPAERDSDFDTLEDLFELTERYITVNSASVPVKSKPLSANSDEDLFDDGEEYAAGTNPEDPDTDGDGTNDDAEAALGRDPRITDKRISVEVASAVVIDADGDAGGGAEPRVDVSINLNDSGWEKKADLNGNDIEEDDSFLSDPITLYEGVFVSDTRLVVKFEGYEEDTCWSGCINKHDDMTTETETIWIDTAPATGQKSITVDMKETDGYGTHFRFVLTVREISTSS
jgi:hypothetical protein